MKITALEKQKKNKKRYNLYIDDEFFEGVEENTIALLNLYVGKELTDGEDQKIRSVEQEEKLHGKALALLSRYRKTEAEMMKYICSRGYSEAMAEVEILRLKEYRFIDDENYVRDSIDLNNSDSRRMLLFKLRRKGVREDLILKIMEKRDMEKREKDVLKRVSAKKYRSLAGKEGLRDRLYRYLMGKGFDSSMIIEAINEIENNQQGERK